MNFCHLSPTIIPARGRVGHVAARMGRVLRLVKFRAQIWNRRIVLAQIRHRHQQQPCSDAQEFQQSVAHEQAQQDGHANRPRSRSETMEACENGEFDAHKSESLQKSGLQRQQGDAAQEFQQLLAAEQAHSNVHWSPCIAAARRRRRRERMADARHTERICCENPGSDDSKARWNVPWRMRSSCLMQFSAQLQGDNRWKAMRRRADLAVSRREIAISIWILPTRDASCRQNIERAEQCALEDADSVKAVRTLHRWAGRPARCTSMGVDDLDLDGSRWIRARATQSIRSSAIRNSNAAEQARPEAEQGPEQDCPNAAQRNGNGQANQLAEKHVAVQQARSSTARASRSDAVGCDAAWGAQATRGGSEEGQAEGRHRDRSKFGWWWFLFPRMAFCTWRGAITVRRSLQLNNLEHAFG
jgi:hypothetical protein